MGGLTLRRGDIVACPLGGKPRPVLIIHQDLFTELPTVAVVPLTSRLRELAVRLSIEPDEDNGLRKPSQILIDKITIVLRDKITSPVIGSVSSETMLAVTRALAVFLGFA